MVVPPSESPLVTLRRARVRYRHEAAFRALVDALTQRIASGHTTTEIMEAATLAVEIAIERVMDEEERRRALAPEVAP